MLTSLGVVLLLWLASLWFRYRRRHANCIPGPRRYPVIGNILCAPRNKPWLSYSAWRKEYGDLILLNGLGKHILVVNSLSHANELLDKRSSTYSDRPEFPMADLTGWSTIHLGFLRYGGLWRLHRRLFHARFRRGVIRKDQTVALQNSRKLLHHLLQAPEKFNEHLELYVASIILSMSYGLNVSSHDDPLLTFIQAVNNALNETLTSSSLVNLFPQLQHLPDWMPGTGFKRQAQRCREEARKVMDLPFDAVKADVANGEGRPSWVLDLLEQADTLEMENEAGSREELLKGVVATGFSAAFETSSSTLKVFIQAMVLFPEAQKRAQAEIDTVLHNGRLPCFEDQDSLPYVSALCQEVRRWRPVLPLGVPHASIADDMYQGYFIPKGTIVFANVWEMCHDTTVYDKPDQFMPERFFDKDGDLAKDTLPAFGFGRRICVGRYLAEVVIWMAVVSTLAAFDITKAKDDDGLEMELSADDYSDGVTISPLPFKCSITPRSNRWRSAVLA